jgi:hypothetical protein
MKSSARKRAIENCHEDRGIVIFRNTTFKPENALAPRKIGERLLTGKKFELEVDDRGMEKVVWYLTTENGERVIVVIAPIFKSFAIWKERISYN